MGTGALTIVAPGSSVQVVIAIVIVMLNLLYVLKTGPYADQTDDFLAFSTSMQMIFTLLVAILLMTDKESKYYDPAFADVVLVVVNTFSLFALLFSLIAMHPKVREKLNNWNSAEKKVEDKKSTGFIANQKVVPVPSNKRMDTSKAPSSQEDEMDDLR